MTSFHSRDYSENDAFIDSIFFRQMFFNGQVTHLNKLRQNDQKKNSIFALFLGYYVSLFGIWYDEPLKLSNYYQINDIQQQGKIQFAIANKKFPINSH